jgi:hypothetical protein
MLRMSRPGSKRAACGVEPPKPAPAERSTPGQPLTISSGLGYSIPGQHRHADEGRLHLPRDGSGHRRRTAPSARRRADQKRHSAVMVEKSNALRMSDGRRSGKPVENTRPRYFRQNCADILCESACRIPERESAMPWPFLFLFGSKVVGHVATTAATKAAATRRQRHCGQVVVEP